jgi:hypothetical protein
MPACLSGKRRWRFHDRDNPKRQAWERIKREARAERERRAAPHLAGLTSLDLSYNGIGDPGRGNAPGPTMNDKSTYRSWFADGTGSSHVSKRT